MGCVEASCRQPAMDAGRSDGAKEDVSVYLCRVCGGTIYPQDIPLVSDKSVILTRPRYPWERWTQTPLANGLSKTKRQPSEIWTHNSLSDFGKPTPKLNAFLFGIETKDAERYPREVNNRIMDQVCTEVENLFGELAEKHPENFSDFIVHLVGSVREGTKVGVYDEFDFMIELPVLREPAYEDDAKNKRQRIYLLRNRTRRNLCDQLLESLPPHWKNFKKLDRQTKTTNNLLCLRLPATGQIVFCDIVFATPVLKVSENCRNCRRIPTSSTVYILTNYVLGGGRYQRCFAFDEIHKLVNSLISDSVTRVYRLTKLLIRDCLPPLCDNERFRFRSAVPSYYIKQMLLYMMDEFPKRDDWQEEYLGLRVTQVIYGLYMCVKNGRVLSFYHAMLDHRLTLSEAFWQRCLPGLHELLYEATKGDDSAITSLTALRQVTLKFKETALHDPMWTGLYQMVDCYTRLLDEDRTDTETPIEAPILRDYIQTYMPGEIKLREVNHQLLVAYNSKVYSLKDFQDQILCDYNSIPFIISGNLSALYKKWKNLYQQMYKDVMPRTVCDKYEHAIQSLCY